MWLLSAALVIIATALLVVGLLTDDGLALIGLSIAGSAAAGAILVFVSVRNRRAPRDLAVSG